jgi:hypothetical protein
MHACRGVPTYPTFHIEKFLISEAAKIIPIWEYLLQKYLDGKLPLSVTTGILKSWIIRFKEEYLVDQTFFEPYPEELKDIDALTIYCDGKDYWKQ